MIKNVNYLVQQHGCGPYQPAYLGNVNDESLQGGFPVFIKQDGEIYKVTEIGYVFLTGMNNLKSVEIPDCVTKIEGSAFNSLTGLINVKLPKELTVINYNTFYNCTSLTSITIPDKVTAIGASAFSNCTSLSTINIGENITFVSGDAFYNTALYNSQTTGIVYIDYIACDWKRTGSTNITIRDGTRLLAEKIFYKSGHSGQGKLTINLPTSVKYIGPNAFSNQDYYYNNVADQLYYLGKEEQWNAIIREHGPFNVTYAGNPDSNYGWEIHYAE